MKTSELIGPALDWAVGEAIGKRIKIGGSGSLYAFYASGNPYDWKPSTDWAQGGPIIEREKIELRRGNPLYFPQGNEHGDYYEPLWIAGKQHGSTPLIAAMRCFCASRLGDEIEIPEELK